MSRLASFATEFGKLCNRRLVSKILNGLGEIERQSEMKNNGKILARKIAWLGKTDTTCIRKTPYGDTLVDWVYFPRGRKADWDVADWPPRKIEITVRELTDE